LASIALLLVSRKYSGPVYSDIPLYCDELPDADKIAGGIKEYQNRFANPFIAAERGYIDEVIPPRSTRRRICRALNMLRNKTVENP
jgi:propionyl-CoA carboxylase beta chain